MKKVLILLTVTLCSTSFYAQDLDLGIKAGMNFSNITDATGLSNRTGFVFGAFAGAKLGDKIGIQGDLLYSQQGAEFDGGEIDLNYGNNTTFTEGKIVNIYVNPDNYFEAILGHRFHGTRIR